MYDTHTTRRYMMYKKVQQRRRIRKEEEEEEVKKTNKKKTIPLNTCWQLLNEIFYKMSHKKLRNVYSKHHTHFISSRTNHCDVCSVHMHTDYYYYYTVEKLTIYTRPKITMQYYAFVLSGYQRKRFSTSCLDRCFPSV